MVRKKTPDTKTTHFILKVTETHHSVSTFVANLTDEPDSYFHNFRTDKLICVAIPPSEMLDIQLELDIACNRRPYITPKDVEEWAQGKVSYDVNKSLERIHRERDELIKENHPSSFGHIYKFNGKWRGYLSLEPDVWQSSHILLCSGKNCYVSVFTHRKPRQRDYMIRSFSVSTEPEE